jgi:MazG family protein
VPVRDAGGDEPAQPGPARPGQVPAGPAQPGAGLLRLVAVMDRLRTDCPWDAKQTHATLAPYLLEESYEALDALESGDQAALREELGDVLLQVAFHARVAAERTDGTGYTIDDVADGIVAKLVRRHPHVFARDAGEAGLDSAEQVRKRWEEIKAEERRPGAASATPKTLLSGIAPALPALLRAYHIGVRARSVGFEWPTNAGVIDKIQEEVDELREVVEAPGPIDQARAEEEMGDLLFSMAHLSRRLGIEPETALRKANDKFTRRFGIMERAITESGRAMTDMTLEQMEAEWQRAKSSQHDE